MKKKLFVYSLLFLLCSCSGGEASKSHDYSSGRIIIANSNYELSLCEQDQIEVTSLNLPSEEYVYSSSDPSVISIDENSGKMSALSEGQATIRVAYQKAQSVYGEANFTVSKGEGQEYTYHDFNQKIYRSHSTPTKGEVNILVLPVIIEGFEESATKENLARIDECFNSKELTRFESVSSYYEKSSYGQLKLNFKVPDTWYESGLTPEELQAQAWRDDLGVSRLSISALDWYEKTYPEDPMTNYDVDKDGCVDGIWMIYSAPVMGENADYYKKLYPNIDPSGFWAYTLSNYVIRDEMHNVSSPVAKMICWAGMDFMDGFGDGLVDAHTYIHETGHMLGLKDYYSTYSPYDCPSGCVDMMDNNIGDHSAFSKYTLGWVKPIVVKEEKTFYLPSFQESGEFLLITNDNWNNTPFDEYFTVELLTPTGLNKEDYTSPYEDNGLQGYSKAGVRISHIDNRPIDRLAHFTSNSDDFYNDPISNTACSGLTMFFDEQGKKGPMYLNRIMQKNIATAEYTVLDSSRAYYGAVRYKERGDGEKTRLANPDDALFYAGDSFDLTESSPYCELMTSKSNTLDKYHDSNDSQDVFPYQIKVESIDEGGAYISISSVE